MSSDLYEKWLSDLFDHDKLKGDWQWDDETEDYLDDEHLVVEFVTKTFNHFREDVASYSDWQIAMGINFIINENQSYAFDIRDGSVPLEKRLDAISSIKNLYTYCFDPRCERALSHLGGSKSPLNNVCYMFWDITPLGYCEDHPKKNRLYETVTEVMEYALTLNNIACIESGLHGLGHMVYDYPRVTEIVQAFIKKSPDLPPDLLEYAQTASTGYIQ